MKLTAEEIREYWAKQARTHGLSVKASWSDQMAVELEVAEILKHLSDGQVVLDAGCANGHSTIRFARERALRIRGVDQVPDMIEQAQTRLRDEQLQSEVSFALGDITALREPAAAYDRVVVIRVLINLPDEDRQRTALAECAHVLRPGGLLLLSEATLQGWRQMNSLRREWRLPDIPEPDFNRYVDEARIAELAGPSLALREVSNFSSTYYVGTRVLKPLLATALGLDLDVADPDAEWNRWCASLPAWGDYGTQKLFIFEKRS